MAATHLKAGEDFFGGKHGDMHRDFGFHGSAPKARGGRANYADGGSASPPFASDSPTEGSKRTPEPEEDGGGDFAKGGMAKGGHLHPHGHHIVSSEPAPGGGVIMRHAHGGFTHMAPDGTSTHCDAAGGMCNGGKMAGGGGVEDQHDSSEYAHGGRTKKADGGLMHDDASNTSTSPAGSFPEEPTSMPRQMGTDETAMARGGRARLPSGMKPSAMQRHSPINTPPRNPTTTRTPRNIMPGGQMAYGVQPSSEPDPAGADQGIPQLADGGKVRMGADRGNY